MLITIIWLVTVTGNKERARWFDTSDYGIKRRCQAGEPGKFTPLSLCNCSVLQQISLPSLFCSNIILSLCGPASPASTLTTNCAMAAKLVLTRSSPQRAGSGTLPGRRVSCWIVAWGCSADARGQRAAHLHPGAERGRTGLLLHGRTFTPPKSLQ